MAGRGYPDELAYARLRRWDGLSEQWVNHFNQEILVEVISSGGRTLLRCGDRYNSEQFQCPIDDATITRTSNDVFGITSQRMALQLHFRSINDADTFQRHLGRLQFRDDRPPIMSPDQRQFDRGGPFPSHGQQRFNQQPPGDPQYGYGRQGSQGQYDQQRYGGQDPRWDQRQPMAGPGRDNNRYSDQPVYQNVPVGGAQYGRDQYAGGRAQHGGGGAQFEDQNRHQFSRGGGAPYGGDEAPYGGGGAPYGGDSAPYGGGGAQYERNQAPYDDRGHMYNQHQGMDQGQNRGMQPGPGQQGYQQGGPPGRGVQDVPHRPKDAWGDRQDFSTQPFNIDTATTDLANAINGCDLDKAYRVIDQLDKLDKAQRVFNIKLEHFGEVKRQEEEPVKEEEKNEFRLKVAIERQCGPNENSIDIVIKAKEDDTIEQLVNLFETQYNIPGEVQRWIIKQQLASDRAKCTLKEFAVTKDGGLEQEVYLFVIQGMKERIKEEFLNKRQQQVEDDQRQQQHMAQQENLRKQTQITSNTAANAQLFSVMPTYDNNMAPPQQQQQYHQQEQQQQYQQQQQQQYHHHQQQSYNAQNQPLYMNVPANQAPPQNMRPSIYQDQQPMRASEQPPFRPQQQPYQHHQEQREFGYDIGAPGPPRADQYRPIDRHIPEPAPYKDEHREMDRYNVGAPRQEQMPAHHRYDQDPGQQRDQFPGQMPMSNRYQDHGPPRHEYQSKQPARQAEIQPPHVAMMEQNNPPPGAAGGIAVLPVMPQQRTQANMQPPPVAPKAAGIGQAEKPSGWNCPKCTFLNEPYRPGCKMCSSSPPEGYEPPADHVPTAEEMKFMQ